MKKFISLIAALSMMMSAAVFTTVAHAASNPSLTVEVANVSDENWAVGTTFELHVSYDGVETSLNEDTGAGTALSAVQFEIGLPDYGTNYTKNGFSWQTDVLKSSSYSSATMNLVDDSFYYYGWAGNVTAEGAYRVGSGDVLVLKLKTLVAGDPGDFYIRTDDASADGAAKIGTITFDDNLGIASQAEYTYDSKEYKLTLYPGAGGSVDATPAGTFTDAADAQAVAYVAELDSSASGQTGRWYATINGTPMKTVKTFTLPNFSAEKVKLGLVYKGAETVEDVAFKWE